jgi:single-strand DNA-binding protein
MRETEITLRGVVITEPTTRQAGDAQVTNFRLAATPRYYDRRQQAWVDGEPVYVTVSSWRNLAVNVAASVVKRDRVVVAGRVRTPQYVVDGVKRNGFVVEADTIGHDLGYGTASFQWGRPKVAAEEPARELADEMARQADMEGQPDDLAVLLAPPTPQEEADRRAKAVALARATAATRGSDPDELDDDLDDDELDDDVPEGLDRATGELVGSGV